MNKNLTSLVRIFLLLGSFYMLFEALIHFLNLRLLDVAPSWPTSALIYSSWMSNFYASLSLFISILLFYMQNDLGKNQNLIKLTAAYGVFHASMLVLGNLSVKFDTIYQSFPSLSFWLPTYNGILTLEAIFLYSFGLTVFLWLASLRGRSGQKRN